MSLEDLPATEHDGPPAVNGRSSAHLPTSLSAIGNQTSDRKLSGYLFEYRTQGQGWVIGREAPPRTCGCGVGVKSRITAGHLLHRLTRRDVGASRICLGVLHI